MDMNFQELQNAVRNISDTVNLGFANMNSTICAQQYETANLLNQMNISNLQTANAQNIAAMQNQNATERQLSDCCCKLENMLSQAEYNRATDTCAITTAIQNAARDIIQNDNCNYRNLHDEQIALQIQQKDATIAQLQGALDRCNTQNIATAAVQSAVDQIRAPYIQVPVAAPFQWPFQYSNGCNNNCCGGNNFSFA